MCVDVETLVVGAGVAGLSCARSLQAEGMDVRVVEKSRGVGGRCATRRIRGQPVDHGLAFYHGDDPAFLDELRSVDSMIPWPRRVVGAGAPCQPRAFHSAQETLACRGGVSEFPKRLAAGLAIDFERCVTGLDADDDRIRLRLSEGQEYRARCVVLTPPAPQTATLVRSLQTPDNTSLGTIVELLRGVSLVRCLTLIAGYPAGTELPDWDMCYPRDSDILQLVSLDSKKRGTGALPAVVFQARPGWSAQQWDASTESWSRALLDAAGAACGAWAAHPQWTDIQRWRYARLAGGDSLRNPLLLRLANGCTLGIVGEAMSGGGGVQAAWLSGRRMASRLLGDERA